MLLLHIMIRVEPNLPENPLQPPQSTAVGVLDLTPSLATPTKMPGIPLNDQLQVSRLNYCGNFEVSSSDVVGNYVFGCDPLSFWMVQPDFPTFLPASWSMNTRCAQFGNLVPTLTFQAVKVTSAPCQLRALWKPPVPLPGHMDDFAKAYSRLTDVGGWDSRWKRNPLYIWDLASSDIFTIQFPGIRTYDLFDMYYTSEDNVYLSDYTAYSVGTMKLEVNLPYMPGSIYPASFQVNVFKSWSVCDLYVFDSYPQAASINPDRTGYTAP